MLVLLVALCIRGTDSMGLEKIVGGGKVDITSVPYTLSFRLSGVHACGACIIGTSWAVTAAHCVKAAKGDLSRISIRSGSSWRNGGGILHKVTVARVHEKFNDMNEDNDIAVIKVDPPFSFNKSTQPAILKCNSSVVDRSWGWVTGWGYIHESDRRLPNKLRGTPVPQVNWNQCFQDYAYRYTLTKEQVCYGLQEGTRDSCKGDSGSPLVNKDFVLLGITSWGEGCGEQFSPGVYTNVLLYRNWIWRNTKRTRK